MLIVHHIPRIMAQDAIIQVPLHMARCGVSDWECQSWAWATGSPQGSPGVHPSVQEPMPRKASRIQRHLGTLRISAPGEAQRHERGHGLTDWIGAQSAAGAAHSVWILGSLKQIFCHLMKQHLLIRFFWRMVTQSREGPSETSHIPLLSVRMDSSRANTFRSLEAMAHPNIKGYCRI